MVRRVVTGLDGTGRSSIIIDGAIPPPLKGRVNIAWRTPTVPADNSGCADIDDAPFDFEMMHGGGSVFSVLDYPPGMSTFMHATDTLDYVIVLQGKVVLVTETGEVQCSAGDVIVDRGVLHAWRNDTDAPATIAVINLPAKPVGAGRTV
jgi:quercetin dioxygenase-like cupin family protein